MAIMCWREESGRVGPAWTGCDHSGYGSDPDEETPGDRYEYAASVAEAVEYARAVLAMPEVRGPGQRESFARHTAERVLAILG